MAYNFDTGRLSTLPTLQDSERSKSCTFDASRQQVAVPSVSIGLSGFRSGSGLPEWHAARRAFPPVAASRSTTDARKATSARGLLGTVLGSCTGQAYGRGGPAEPAGRRPARHRLPYSKARWNRHDVLGRGNGHLLRFERSRLVMGFGARKQGRILGTRCRVGNQSSRSGRTQAQDRREAQDVSGKTALRGCPVISDGMPMWYLLPVLASCGTVGIGVMSIGIGFFNGTL